MNNPIVILFGCTLPDTKREPVTTTRQINKTFIKEIIDTVKTSNPVFYFR